MLSHILLTSKHLQQLLLRGVSPQAAGWGGDPLILRFCLTRFKGLLRLTFPVKMGAPKLFKFDT